MSTAAPSTRRLYRRPRHGLTGGVADGIAEHLGMRPWLVRVLFGALTIAGGLGLALYGAYWIVLPIAPDVPPSRVPKWVGSALVAIVVAAAIAGLANAAPHTSFVVPTVLACLGAALIWRQASETDRGRWLRLSRTSLVAGTTNRTGRARLAAGSALIAVGGVLVLRHANLSSVRDGVVAMLITVVGLGLVSGPWWMRLVAQLGAERSERIREQERADIAAHLHDSVLQTLALIQRNASSPREVTRLARGQERELRSLLYRERAAEGQLGEALRTAAGEVEDAYAISVDVVLVGDTALTEALAAAVAAAREALVNAAKHSGVTSVSLYAEVETDEVNVFVKDRGVGFDVDQIADDRQGVRGSIIARIERHGGTVVLTSNPGTGTDIRITMPLTDEPR